MYSCNLQQKGLLTIMGTQWTNDPDGQWPMWGWVEHRAMSYGMDNPRAVLDSLPRIGNPPGPFGLSYGFTTVVDRFLQDDTRVALTVAATWPLDEARSDLADPFLRALRHMVLLWQNAPRSPNELTQVTLTSKDLQSAFPHMRPRIISILPEIFGYEPFLHGSRSRQPDGSWTMDIPKHIMQYGHVNSVQEYISTVSRLVHETLEADRALLLGRSATAPIAEASTAVTEYEPETASEDEPGQRKLVLGREWILGDRIGGGGFGAVFEAWSETGEPAAVKLVPQQPGAERELLFTELKDVPNVVPVIDKGEANGHMALVMPRAEKSLRAHLEDGPLPVDEAVRVLTDIAETLVGMEDREEQVVHRDLKPENVLLLRGHWCLADFGMARYAEAATAKVTFKFGGSAPYMAPERWKGERARSASDIYALGVLAYELVQGTTPYTGPDAQDFQEQHVHGTPPPLTTAPPLLAALITECLYRAPGSRPAAGNVLGRLKKISGTPLSGGLAALAEANRLETTRRAHADLQDSEQVSETERRKHLLEAATTSFEHISERLLSVVSGVLSAASVDREDAGWTITLNEAQLALTGATATTEESGESDSTLPFDVIAFATISVKAGTVRHGYEGRSHSLWYADAQAAGRYQWFETAFTASGLVGGPRSVEPFALDPKAGRAVLAPVMATKQAAWPFTPLDIGDLDQLIDRWSNWLAHAATGQLQRPDHTPDPQGSWRH